MEWKWNEWKTYVWLLLSGAGILAIGNFLTPWVIQYVTLVSTKPLPLIGSSFHEVVAFAAAYVGVQLLMSKFYR